jgi:YHS domain-containing protein
MRSILLVMGVLVLTLNGQPLGAAQPALEGNCPVCLYEMGKLVPGKKEHQATFDRLTYWFPAEKQRQMFLAAPEKYAPVLAGDCTVCLVEMGARMPGKAKFALKHAGRMYLFPSEKQLAMFKADPGKYAEADVAYERHCPVCLLDMKKRVLGKGEHVSTYDGLRYFFPGLDQKRKFEANPAQYAPDEAARTKFMADPSRYANVDLAAGGNCVVCQKMMNKQVAGTREHMSVYKGLLYLFPGKKEKALFDADPAGFVVERLKAAPGAGQAPAQEVRVIGTTACAGCAYGVRPLTDPASLGLAVVTADRVYVVEGAEQRFPQLYSRRFDGINVELRGSVRHRDGRFVWVEPAILSPVR